MEWAFPIQQVSSYIQATSNIDLVSENTNRCCLLTSDLLDTKWSIFPLALCQRGITIWLDYNTSPYLGWFMRAIGSKTHGDDTATIAIDDVWFKFSDTKLYVEHIVLPDSFKM